MQMFAQAFREFNVGTAGGGPEIIGVAVIAGAAAMLFGGPPSAYVRTAAGVVAAVSAHLERARRDEQGHMGDPMQMFAQAFREFNVGTAGGGPEIIGVAVIAGAAAMLFGGPPSAYVRTAAGVVAAVSAHLERARRDEQGHM
uniref:Oxidoreductase n=1 Tax=Globodera pallida TaxID=36090 RepID=A0A183BLD5_GLOPA